MLTLGAAFLGPVWAPGFRQRISFPWRPSVEGSEGFALENGQSQVSQREKKAEAGSA